MKKKLLVGIISILSVFPIWGITIINKTPYEIKATGRYIDSTVDPVIRRSLSFSTATVTAKSSAQLYNEFPKDSKLESVEIEVNDPNFPKDYKGKNFDFTPGRINEFVINVDENLKTLTLTDSLSSSTASASIEAKNKSAQEPEKPVKTRARYIKRQPGSLSFITQ